MLPAAAIEELVVTLMSKVTALEYAICKAPEETVSVLALPLAPKVTVPLALIPSVTPTVELPVALAPTDRLNVVLAVCKPATFIAPPMVIEPV